MKLFYVCVASLLLLSGCGTMTKPTVTLQNTYDVAKTQFLLQKGDSTIKGSALLRQAGGGIVTCAGNEVYLIPETPYSTERIQYIYGNTEKSFLDPYNPNIKGFSNDNPDFLKTGVKIETCNAQGFFHFDQIKDGTYYLTTKIIWTVGYLPEGGGLMQKITVDKGETKDVVLTY